MAIPPIAPYSLPTRSDIASNQVAWSLDPSRAALLIHDMQRYFIDTYESDRDPILTATANIQRLRKQCADAGIPVIYTMQPGDQHPSRRGILADFWGSGLANGPATEVIAQLTPGPGDIQVTKWRYSAFQRTDLRELLNHYNRDQLVITGVYAHMGCMLSAADAFMNDIKPFVVLDATADFGRDEHVMAMNYVARRCGAVTTTDALENALQHSNAA
ncbi:isochorismatase family protein [Nocardia sp. NPDC049149]|uniref:isochorismatase family protein n=1 Tax=Nocardia sp. NPDC049149 TaxID=3364315 RepID=UPI00371F1B5B